MDNISLAIVGCGVMGNRHLNGLIALHKAGLSKIRLSAVCDPIIDNAESLAKRAGEIFNHKIKVVQRLSDLKGFDVNAIDITTVPWEHHKVAIEAMQMGMHVMVEKPMGLTIRACKIMLEEAEQSGCILSVAENFHHDPINIIGRELIKAEAIGKPRLIIQNSIGGGNSIIVTPWRHNKRGGGPLLDVGVHYSYVTEYLMGEAESVYAHTRLHEKIRKNAQNEVQADAEDAVYASILFKNGSVGQFVEDHAGHGQGLWQRVIYGSKGSLNLPGDRSGKPVNLIIDGIGSVSSEKTLELIPNYRLNEITANLFGGERISHYELNFPEIDSGLIAVEYCDFAESILKKRLPSVDVISAMRSVGLIYAMLESARLGRAVKMDEIMNEKATNYQDEINAMIGL